MKAYSKRQVRESSPIRKLGIALLLFLGCISVCLAAQDATPGSNFEPDANQFAQDVFHNEIDAQNRDHSLWSYLDLKEENGKTKFFRVCQTKDGEIDRLLAVNGQKLNPKQRQAEDQRIHRMLNHLDRMRKKQKKQHEDARQAEKLMQMFPDAFRFQYYGLEGSLIKLKFKPNPNFHPSGHAAQVFQHVQGSLLVDRQRKRLAEINGRLTSEVEFLDGFLGHLDKGATFLVKQQDVGSGHWELTTLDVEMNGRRSSLRPSLSGKRRSLRTSIKSRTIGLFSRLLSFYRTMRVLPGRVQSELFSFTLDARFFDFLISDGLV